MLRGKGKRPLSKSSASRSGSHSGASSNTSHDVRDQTSTSLSTGRGGSFVPQTRESLSSARADGSLPHTSSSFVPLQEHDSSCHDNDDISREVANVEGRGAALPIPPNPESRQELYIRNGKIQPYGRGQWVRCASNMIRSHFKGPWLSWLKVPEAYKQLMWKGFLRSCSNSFRNLLFDARDRAITQSKQVEPHDAWKDFPPNWIEQKDWEELVDFWKSSDWIKRHEAGKQNRAKGAIDGSYCLHTGGSICFDEWGQREMEQNPNVTPIDVFERTHKRNKGDGNWVNPKAQRVSERYNELRAQKRQEGDESEESSINQSDKYFDSELFYDAIGGVKKGTTFGLFVSNFEGIIPPKRCGSTSSSIGCTPLLSQAQLDARLSEQQEKYEAKISELMSSQQQMREDMERQMREEMERQMREKIEQQLQRKEIELEQKFQRQQAAVMEQMRLMLQSAGLTTQLPSLDPPLPKK